MLYYTENNGFVRKACVISNELIKDNMFWAEIIRGPKMDMTDGSNAEIVESIKKVATLTDFEVISFCYWNYFSKMIARFQPSKPEKIQLRKKLIHRPVESLIGSIMHELVHACDYRDMLFSYGHAGNSSIGKEFTAPYLIGKKAKQYSLEHYGDIM